MQLKDLILIDDLKKKRNSGELWLVYMFEKAAKRHNIHITLEMYFLLICVNGKTDFALRRFFLIISAQVRR